MDAKVWEGLHLAHAFGQAGEFDLLHNHYDFLPLTFASLVATPMLTTIHGFSSEQILPVYRAFDGGAHYVSISDADRHPDLHYLATVHHGVDRAELTFQPLTGAYLAFFGRIHPHKGAADAIRVARAAKLPLVMAGIVQDRAYFEHEVEPQFGDDIRYIGPVGPTERGRAPRWGPGTAASDPFRRAVRPVRRGGDGVWHPGRRLHARAACRN